MKNQILYTLILSSALSFGMQEEQECLQVPVAQVVAMVTNIVYNWAQPSRFDVLCHMFQDVPEDLTVFDSDKYYRPQYCSYFEKAIPGITKRTRHLETCSRAEFLYYVQYVKIVLRLGDYVLIPKHCCKRIQNSSS